MKAYSVLLSHHQLSREFGTVAGILNPSAGKHGGSETGSDSDVPTASVSLKRRKGCSFTTGMDRESVSQPSAAKRIFRNIIIGGRKGTFLVRKLG